MTVTYSKEIQTVKCWSFLRLLTRWRGSVYRLVLPDFLFFGGLYTLLSLIYRLALPDDSRIWFEYFCIYCKRFQNVIPLAFILGFFVQLVAKRWWEQFLAIPYPDSIAVLANAYIVGEATTSGASGNAEEEDRATLLRRTILRYVNLSYASNFRRVSYPVKKKIPSEEDFVHLGLMTEEEMKSWNACPIDNKYFLPLIWCNQLISRATEEGFIKSDLYEKELRDEIAAFQGKLGTILTYDYINPPLVYTQVATICIYSYFLATLFGHQFLDPSKNYDHPKVDYYVPFFTLLQFIFYVGWLKVAEELINPFGVDDDDFDMVKLLQRNLQMSGLLTNPKMCQTPALDARMSFDTTDFVFTKSSNNSRRGPETGSAMHLKEGSVIGDLFRRADRQESRQSAHSESQKNDPNLIRLESGLRRPQPSTDVGSSEIREQWTGTQSADGSSAITPLVPMGKHSSVSPFHMTEDDLSEEDTVI